MKYKYSVDKYLFSKTKPLNKAAFKTLIYAFGSQKARVIKQKIKLLLREKPPLTVFSKEERMIFDKLKGGFSVVFDVGIQNDLSFFYQKTNCAYHLFEPNQDFVRLIKEQMGSFKDHNIKLNEFGLSDESGDNYTYYEESESFAVNPTFKDGDVDTGKRYSLRTLDDYVVENDISKIDFLKIDTEGFDYKVILGGLKTIRENKISYIQFEYWNGVKKFVDVLKENFDLFLMMEPRLLKAITETITPLMNHEQKKIDYGKSLIPLTDGLIDLIDNKIVPTGSGGNIFCINKNAKMDRGGLIFDVTY